MSALSVMTTCIVCVVCVTAAAKDYPPGKYPERYGRLTADQWPQARAVLDGVLRSTWDDLADSPACNEAAYVLARIGEIEWDKDRKIEVVGYLAKMASALDGEDRRFVIPEKVAVAELLLREDPRMRLAVAVPRSLLAIDVDAGCKTVQAIWIASLKNQANPYYQFLRKEALQGLRAHHKRDGVIKCLLSLEGLPGIVLTPQESAEMDRIKLRHSLGEFQDQEKAWQYIADNLQRCNLKDTLTGATRWRWREALMALNDTYRTLEAKKPYELAMQEPDLARQYVLLYATCLSVNQKLSASKAATYERGFVGQVVSAVDGLYRKEEVSAAVALKGSVDFLAEACSAMKSLTIETDKGRPAAGSTTTR